MVSRLAPTEVTKTIGYQWLLDVVSLTKPRVMMMIVAVTGAGFIDPQGQSTGRLIVINCLALLGVALMPTLIGMTGTFYFTAMLIVGSVFLGFGIAAARSKTVMVARRLVLVSLLYIPVTFILMAVDKTPRL